jgi:hypothetical protein
MTIDVQIYSERYSAKLVQQSILILNSLISFCTSSKGFSFGHHFL